MKTKHKEFIEKMEAACETHEDWLELIKFGLPTLLGEQILLIELIIREVERETGRAKEEAKQTTAGSVWIILKELGLYLAPPSE